MAETPLSSILGRLKFVTNSAKSRVFDRIATDSLRLRLQKNDRIERVKEAGGAAHISAETQKQQSSSLSHLAAIRDHHIRSIQQPQFSLSEGCVQCEVTADGGQLSKSGIKTSVRETVSSRFSARRLKASFESALQDHLQAQGIEDAKVQLELLNATASRRVSITCHADGSDELIENACKGLFFIPSDLQPSEVHMAFKALSKWMTFLKYDAPFLRVPVNKDLEVMTAFNTWLLGDDPSGKTQFEKGKDFFLRYFQADSKVNLFKELFQEFLVQQSGNADVIDRSAAQDRDLQAGLLATEKRLLEKRYELSNSGEPKLLNKALFETQLKRFHLKQRLIESLHGTQESVAVNDVIATALDAEDQTGVFTELKDAFEWVREIETRPPQTLLECQDVLNELHVKIRHLKSKERNFKEMMESAGFEKDGELPVAIIKLRRRVTTYLETRLNEMGSEELSVLKKVRETPPTLQEVAEADSPVDKLVKLQKNIQALLAHEHDLSKAKEALLQAYSGFQLSSGEDEPVMEGGLPQNVSRLILEDVEEALTSDEVSSLREVLKHQVDALADLEAQYLESLDIAQAEFAKELRYCIQCEGQFEWVLSDEPLSLFEAADDRPLKDYTRTEKDSLRKAMESLQGKLSLAYALKYRSPIAEFRTEVGKISARSKRTDISLIDDPFLKSKLQTLASDLDAITLGAHETDSAVDTLKEHVTSIKAIYDGIDSDESIDKGSKNEEIRRLVKEIARVYETAITSDPEDLSVLKEKETNIKELVKAAKTFMANAIEWNYFDDPKFWGKYTYINEGVLLESGSPAFTDLCSRVQGEDSHKRYDEETFITANVKRLKGTTLDPEKSDKQSRAIVRQVKHVAKQYIVHIKAQTSPSESKKAIKLALKNFKDILQFKHINEPQIGVDLAIRCLNTIEMTTLLDMCGGKKAEPPPAFQDLFSSLKSRFDANPGKQIVKDGRNIFDRISKQRGQDDSLNILLSKLVDMRTRFIHGARREGLGLDDDPLFIKARLKIIDKVLSSVSGLHYQTTELGPDLDPDFPEAALLGQDLSIRLNIFAEKFLRRLKVVLERCLDAIELREYDAVELNALAPSEDDLTRKYAGRGEVLTYTSHYSFMEVLESLGRKVAKDPSKYGIQIEQMRTNMKPGVTVLDVPDVVDKSGTVVSRTSATIAARSVFDERPEIKLDKPGESTTYTAETISELSKYQLKIKQLIYRLTEYKTGYISPKTIWRVVLSGGTPLEERSLLKNLDSESRFALLRLMYEYTVVGQLLKTLSGPGALIDDQDAPFLKGIRPEFYTQQTWAMPVLPEAVYPGQVDDLTKVVTELIRKAIDPHSPIVFSAKQLPGIMKMHHADQGGANGHSITQTWICATGGGKTTLGKHMPQLFRSHVILVSPIAVPGATPLTKDNFVAGQLDSTTLPAEPTLFYINARELRDRYKASGNELDLGDAIVLFDEFDKVDVYGPLNEAVEGVSKEQRSLHCKSVLKMSATSELSIMVLEQVTSNFRLKGLAEDKMRILRELDAMDRDALVSVLNDFYREDEVKMAYVLSLIEDENWMLLVDDCLNFEAEEIRRRAISPIDRLEELGEGDEMMKFLNLLTRFKDCNEGLDRYSSVAKAAADDVFEAMTRVKRHFSDTQIHVKEVDFELPPVAQTHVEAMDVEAVVPKKNLFNILNQFSDVVKGVLSAPVDPAKNVSLIEDFFLTFDNADDSSVPFSQEELLNFVNKQLNPDQECRVAFMTKDSEQVVYQIKKDAVPTLVPNGADIDQVEGYGHHILVLYKRDEDRGVDWPMSRVRHVKMTAGIPPKSLFRLIPALQWMGRLRGVDERSGDDYVDLPDLDLYLEKETLQEVAGKMDVDYSLIQWCMSDVKSFSSKAEKIQSVAQLSKILKQAPISKLSDIDRRFNAAGAEANFERIISDKPQRFKALFLQTLITQFMFLNYADSSAQTVRDHVRKEEDDLFETNLIKGFYEWVKAEKTRLLKEELTSNMFSLDQEIRDQLFDAFDQVMGIQREQVDPDLRATLTKDLLAIKDVVKAGLEERISTSTGIKLSPDDQIKYTPELWRDMFSSIWTGSHGVESRRDRFVEIAREITKKIKEKQEKAKRLEEAKVARSTSRARLAMSRSFNLSRSQKVLTELEPQEVIKKLQRHAMKLTTLLGQDSVTTLLTMLAQESWESVPESLKKHLSKEGKEFLKVLLRSVGGTSLTNRVGSRLSYIVQKDLLKCEYPLNASGRRRGSKKIFVPIPERRTVEEIVSMAKLMEFSATPIRFLLEDPDQRNDKQEKKLWEWFGKKSTLKSLLEDVGFSSKADNLSAADKVLHLQFVLNTKKKGRESYTHFDEDRYLLLSAIEEPSPEQRNELKQLEIQKRKQETLIRISKIYWEYRVRRTMQYGFEVCAFEEVHDKLWKEPEIHPSPSMASVATPQRSRDEVRFGTPQVPRTGDFFGSLSTVDRRGGGFNASEFGDPQHRRIKAQHSLKTSMELYKTAKSFSIILLQLYAQLVRFDQSNINQVRELLAMYMDDAHGALSGLMNVRGAGVDIQSRWMEQLAKELMVFVKHPDYNSWNTLEKKNLFLGCLMNFTQQMLSERKERVDSGSDEEEKGEEAPLLRSNSGLPPKPRRSIPNLFGRRDHRDSAPMLGTKMAWESPLGKHSIASPVQLRASMDELDQSYRMEKHRRGSNASSYSSGGGGGIRRSVSASSLPPFPSLHAD
jgi:hypothetical protein